MHGFQEWRRTFARGMLSAVRIVKVVPRKRCDPVAQELPQISTFKMRSCFIHHDHGKSCPFNCRAQDQARTVEGQLARRCHPLLFDFFLKLLGIDAAGGEQA